MPRMIRHPAVWCLLALFLALPGAAAAQGPPSSLAPQTQEDDYTRYELLAPESAQFRIIYEVTATRPGARLYLSLIHISEPTRPY